MKKNFKILASLVLLSSILHCNGSGQHSKWRRRRHLGDKDDLSEFLDDILNKRKENAADQGFCISNIEEQTGVILRTRDSVNKGAKFLEAPDGVKTVKDCKEACCKAATGQSSRGCDLAVYQENGYDSSEGQPRCFLFSCTKDGKDVCETAVNEDYKVLKVKKEKVEAQLIDVATMASITSERSENAEEKNHGVCEKQFTKKAGFIIKTRQSIENGAQFLEAPKSVTTADECRSHCCETKMEGTMPHCDMAVFQEKDDDPNDRQERCYLFSCVAENGESKCITSPNGDYVVMKREVEAEEDQLFDIAASSAVTTVTSKASTARLQATTSTAAAIKSTHPITIAAASTSTKTTLTGKTVSEGVHDLKSCKRLEWQCRDGTCIRVTDVCNEIFDCTDGSDEDECELLKSTKTTIKSVEQADVSSSAPTKTIPISSSPLTTSESNKHTRALPEFELPAEQGDGFTAQRTEPQRGAVLPLALGLSVTACVLLMVVCRMQVMKKKLRRRGKPLSMEESDYLINGMYL